MKEVKRVKVGFKEVKRVNSRNFTLITSTMPCAEDDFFASNNECLLASCAKNRIIDKCTELCLNSHIYSAMLLRVSDSNPQYQLHVNGPSSFCSHFSTSMRTNVHKTTLYCINGAASLAPNAKKYYRIIIRSLVVKHLTSEFKTAQINKIKTSSLNSMAGKKSGKDKGAVPKHASNASGVKSFPHNGPSSSRLLISPNSTPPSLLINPSPSGSLSRAVNNISLDSSELDFESGNDSQNYGMVSPYRRKGSI